MEVGSHLCHGFHITKGKEIHLLINGYFSFFGVREKVCMQHAFKEVLIF